MRQNKKTYLPILVLILTPLLLWILVFLIYSGLRELFPLRFANTAQVNLIFQREILNSIDNYNFFILGDSSASTAIWAKKLSPKALNLAQFGASPIESYHTLKRVIDQKSDQKECLFLVQTYVPSMYWQDWFWSISVANKLISWTEYREMQKTFPEHIFLSSFNNIFSPFRFTSFMANMDINSLQRLQSGIFSNRQKRMKFYLSRISKQAGSLPIYDSKDYPFSTRGFRANWHNFLNQDFVKDPVFDHYLIKLFDLASKNFKYTFVFHPPLASSVYSPSSSYLDGYHKHYKQLSGKFDKVHYLKYEPISPDSEFMDIIHMTGEGSKRYTLDIKKRLKKSKACGFK